MLSNLKSVAAAVAQEGLFERGSGRWVGRAIVLSVAVFSAWALASQVLPLPVSLVLTAFLATASALLGALAVTLSYLDARRINEHATATLRKESDRAKKHIALHDVATAIFHRWYFDLRLDEETRRSQRYGQPVSVIALRVRPTPELSAGAAAESLNMQYAQLAARALRAVDIPASLGEFEYAACLPNTDQRYRGDGAAAGLRSDASGRAAGAAPDHALHDVGQVGRARRRPGEGRAACPLRGRLPDARGPHEARRQPGGEDGGRRRPRLLVLAHQPQDAAGLGRGHRHLPGPGDERDDARPAGGAGQDKRPPAASPRQLASATQRLVAGRPASAARGS